MRLVGILFTIAALPTVISGQAVEVGTYVMTQGGAEISHENYRFDGTTLSDTAYFPTRGVRLVSVADYDSSRSPIFFKLDVFGVGEVSPFQTVTVMFADSAASWTTSTATGDSSGVSQLESPYAFMQNLVFAQLAVVLLKYDHDLGGTQRVRVWMPETVGTTEMEMTFSAATTGVVRIANTTMNVEVNEHGWLQRATVPMQNVVVERQERIPFEIP